MDEQPLSGRIQDPDPDRDPDRDRSWCVAGMCATSWSRGSFSGSRHDRFVVHESASSEDSPVTLHRLNLETHESLR
ncbi:uncharacterized protein V6R79_021732 [Siganus canaliculatus]